MVNIIIIVVLLLVVLFFYLENIKQHKAIKIYWNTLNFLDNYYIEYDIQELENKIKNFPNIKDCKITISQQELWLIEVAVAASDKLDYTSLYAFLVNIVPIRTRFRINYVVE